jgi:hypothetical protein
MGIRDKLRRGAQAYLAPGETIEAVFLVKRREVIYNDRALIATDRRLLLLEVNRWGGPIGVLAEQQRAVRLGPCTKFMHPMRLFGTVVWVNRRFYRDVDEADRLAGF